MKVAALTRTSSIGPSTRYRILQYVPLLARHGIEVRSHPLFGPTWFRILKLGRGPLRLTASAGYSLSRLLARIAQLMSAEVRHADIVHVEQQLFPYLPLWAERLLWPRRARTVLEFDDAIHLTAGHRHKLEGLCALADLVIVGNRFLADFARPFARQLVVIPTTVDLDAYTQARAVQQRRRTEQDGTLRVGWIGLPYNMPYLLQLAEPLARLAQSGRSVELRVISSGLPEPDPAWGRVRLVHRRWSVATEAVELGACDVGVMPLPDTDWARGKCGLKLLQCMAAEVPVICSPVGVNADFIEDEQNGLTADPPDAWADALARLADDPDLRARLGRSGLKTVQECYSIDDGAEKVREAYGLALGLAEGDRAHAPPAPSIRRR
jgi:glycosyltransferase involved in cell wall biosynthesis